jgi:hypothetical protein
LCEQVSDEVTTDEAATTGDQYVYVAQRPSPSDWKTEERGGAVGTLAP